MVSICLAQSSIVMGIWSLAIPLAELGGTDGVHSIANADDGIKVIKLKCAIDISITFASNYREILESSLFFQFSALIDILQMETNIVHGTVE